MQTDTFEYLLSRHYLKRMLAENIITYDEFNEIDRLNKEKFLGRKSADGLKKLSSRV